MASIKGFNTTLRQEAVVCLARDIDCERISSGHEYAFGYKYIVAFVR